MACGSANREAYRGSGTQLWVYSCSRSKLWCAQNASACRNTAMLIFCSDFLHLKDFRETQGCGWFSVRLHLAADATCAGRPRLQRLFQPLPLSSDPLPTPIQPAPHHHSLLCFTPHPLGCGPFAPRQNSSQRPCSGCPFSKGAMRGGASLPLLVYPHVHSPFLWLTFLHPGPHNSPPIEGALSIL